MVECIKKTIPNFSKYSIYPNGLVIGPSGKARAVRIVAGYPSLTMKNDEGKTTTTLLHRLLAICFILNPDNLDTVDHKDNDKLNFSLDNLQWMSQIDNTTKDQGHKIYSVHKNGTVECWDSISQAASSLSGHAANISARLLGKTVGYSLNRKWYYQNG